VTVLNKIALPFIHAWHSRFGLVESYEYPCGRADAMPVHAHREMQICFSLDFPGRYAYRGKLHEVPIGAVSVLDSWEPHAASDPCDRRTLSHYLMVYVDPIQFRSAIGLPSSAPIGDPIRIDAPTIHRFRALHDALRFDAPPLEQDERYGALASGLFGRALSRAADPSAPALARARDYIAAHAVERIGVRDVAAQADLSPWHFVRAFRRRFGVPPHRFQLCMRIDIARRLLAAGMSASQVAHSTGFADQSHLVRSFKRLVGTTPARYRGGKPAMFAGPAATSERFRRRRAR
jgi:AraC-like DNA-binding protein